MKEWVEFSRCVGKTIAGCSFWDSEEWLVSFTDGTWTSIEWGHPGYPEGEMQLQSKQPPLTEYVEDLVELGLIDQNEADRLLEERNAKRQAEVDARERAEYKRLHAKFGKGEL